MRRLLRDSHAEGAALLKRLRFTRDFYGYKEGQEADVESEWARFPLREGAATLIGEMDGKVYRRKKKFEEMLADFTDADELVDELRKQIEDHIYMLTGLYDRVGMQKPERKDFFKSREYLCPVGDVRHVIKADELLVFRSGIYKDREGYSTRFMAWCENDNQYVDVTGQIERAIIRQYQPTKKEQERAAVKEKLREYLKEA